MSRECWMLREPHLSLQSVSYWWLGQTCSCLLQKAWQSNVTGSAFCLPQFGLWDYVSSLLTEFTIINPRPEGYGSRFVVHSFVLSTALQRAALTSSLQLRYEQAKRVDGLQSDGWILLKCFRSRVMAGSPLQPSWTLLKTKPPIVGCPDSSRFDPYCRTALGVRKIQ